MTRRAEVAALAMADDFRRALERADLADAGDDLSVPLDAELEVLVGIDPAGVYGELRHGLSSWLELNRRTQTCTWPASLLERDDDELGGLQRREADDDVDDAEVDVVLRRRLAVAPSRNRRRSTSAPERRRCRKRLFMNAPAASRICAQSGSSFGSNTANFSPR